MRGIGYKTREMDLGMRGSRMVMYMKESIKKERCMGKESIFGPVGSSMKECGFKEIKKGMGFGKDLKETHILASGSRINLTGSESIFGETVTLTKESGKLA